MPAPDGFVMMTQDYQGDNFQRRTYSLVRVNNGVSTTLWQETLEGDVSWELAWVTPPAVASDLPPFPTFTQ